jgi:hypothetical protein
VKFYKGNEPPIAYRIVSEKKEEDPDKDRDRSDDTKRFNGSTQVCLNGLVLVASLFGGLHL